MLEAKAKDQEQSSKCFTQKKGHQKSFSDDLQFIGVVRLFDWGGSKPQITRKDVIKNFQKRNFLRNKDIVGWKI